MTTHIRGVSVDLPGDNSPEPARGDGLRRLFAGVKSDPARWVSFVVTAVAGLVFAVWLLNLDRNQWFVSDEFTISYFSSGHEGLLVWFFRPLNEHTIVFTKAWFWLLSDFGGLGLRHYALFMIPLVGSHLVVVAAIYRLTWISTASRVMATGTALVSLAMGAASGTLTFAIQFSYVGSVAAGLIVILLAVECSTRRAMAAGIALALFGTLNGTAFVAFGLAASLVYARRRLWWAATLVGAIPVVWELASRLVWAQGNPYVAHSLGQILRDGPAFAYALLDTAFSKTLGDPHLTSAVVTAMVLGTLALMSAAPRYTRTAVSGRVAGILAVAAIITVSSLVESRISYGIILVTYGGYSYLLLAALLPVCGILLAHLARSKSSLLGAAGVFVALSLVGMATISSDAGALSAWRLGGERLMQTAAAELAAGMPTFSDQVPVPSTAPSVSQDQLRLLTASGQLDATIAGPMEADQVSLNMQWRMEAGGLASGVCSEFGPGEVFSAPAESSIEVLGAGPGAGIDVRYPSSAAVRHFEVPDGLASGLQTLSPRPAVVTVEGSSVRVCTQG